MPETLALTTPFKPDPRQASTVRVRSITLHFDPDDDEGNVIEVVLRDQGVDITARESGASAKTKIIALNKANLQTKSLQRRILEWAQTVKPVDLAGNIGGTVD